MALVVRDRVKETTTTTGTGTVTLAGASAGFQSFSVIGNANTTYYAITDSITGAWEVGIGTYSTTGPTLSRDTILESSTGGTAVSFGAGSKDVFCTYPAERSMYVDGTTIVPAVSATLPVVSGGTGLSATPSNGQVDIGNGTGFTRATLTAGTGVTITNGSGSKSIAAVNNGTVTSVASGNGMNFTTITGSGTVTMGTPSTLNTTTTNATTATSHTHVITTASANTASTIVARDASGNFSAGTITASLSGNATSATTATTATTATNATNVALTTSATSSAFKVPFANTTVSTTGNYGLLQDSAAEFTYNPSTNTLVVGTFSGALSGNATTATTLATARTIHGVSFNGSANITVTANTTNTLTRGTYLTGNNFNGSAATTWAVDATTTNTASKVVARDASGNFAAGTITAALSGNATTATTATNATNVAVTTSATASAFKIPFANTTVSTTGNYGLLQDSTATFTYNPSTNTVNAGTFSGSLLEATNGIVINSATVSANYTIPTGSNAMSTGPVTVSDGITVTVSDGSNWVVI